MDKEIDDCPFELTLGFVKDPGLEYVLKNISDKVQEFIDDWAHGFATELVIMDEQGDELPFSNVFPPIEPPPIAGYTKLQPGAEYTDDTMFFCARKGILYYNEGRKDTYYTLKTDDLPVPVGYELSEPFAGYYLYEWSHHKQYRMLPGKYRAFCHRGFSAGVATLERPNPQPEPILPGGNVKEEVPEEPPTERWSGGIRSNVVEFELPPID